MRALAIVLALVLAPSIRAQSVAGKPAPAPVDLPQNTRLTRLIPPVAIHAADDPEPPNLTPIQRAIGRRNRIENNFQAIELEIVINESGRVDSATPTAGPERFYDQAVQIEMHRAFAPVRIDGQIARVRTHDAVSIYPPERFSPTHRPLPAKPDLRSITIGLQRTACFGSCLAYSVTLSGTGEITFSSGDTQLAVPGTHHARIPPEVVIALLDQYRQADFLSALDEYRCGWTDLPTQTLTLSIGSVHKQVVDYGGALVGLPDRIAALESAIDKAAHVERWTTGNSDTLSALTAEHWDFSSASPGNLHLYASALDRNNTDLVHLFLAAHAPIATDDPQLLSPVCVATKDSNQDAVKQMLHTLPPGKKPSPNLLAECLSAAALSGDLSMVDLWVDRGARPAAQPPFQERANYMKFRSPVVNAIQSGNPQVLSRILDLHPPLDSASNESGPLLNIVLRRGDTAEADKMLRMLTLLIAAGVDVNASTENEDAPLFQTTFSPSAIPVLIHAGADPNARNHQGQTPLIRNSFIPQVIQQLLANGADPLLRGGNGKTALDEAKTTACKECVTLLETAIAAKLQLPKTP